MNFEKLKIVAEVTKEMMAEGCVNAMVEMFRGSNYDDRLTVFGLKELVKGDIFDEIAANVVDEYVSDSDEFFDDATAAVFSKQMDEAYKRVFPRFMRKVVH